MDQLFFNSFSLKPTKNLPAVARHLFSPISGSLGFIAPTNGSFVLCYQTGFKPRKCRLLHYPSTKYRRIRLLNCLTTGPAPHRRHNSRRLYPIEQT